jgi:hypothetical protein
VLSWLSDSARIWARCFDLTAAHILLLDFTFARLLCSIVLAFCFAVRQSRSLPAAFSSPHVAMLCRFSSALCRKHSRPSFLNARLAQEARVLCAPGRLRVFFFSQHLALCCIPAGCRLACGLFLAVRRGRDFPDVWWMSQALSEVFLWAHRHSSFLCHPSQTPGIGLRLCGRKEPRGSGEQICPAACTVVVTKDLLNRRERFGETEHQTIVAQCLGPTEVVGPAKRTVDCTFGLQLLPHFAVVLKH